MAMAMTLSNSDAKTATSISGQQEEALEWPWPNIVWQISRLSHSKFTDPAKCDLRDITQQYKPVQPLTNPSASRLICPHKHIPEPLKSIGYVRCLSPAYHPRLSLNDVQCK